MPLNAQRTLEVNCGGVSTSDVQAKRSTAASQQKEGDITTSKLVPDARTTMTLTDLTSEVEWDRVLYCWYGRALLLSERLSISFFSIGFLQFAIQVISKRLHFGRSQEPSTLSTIGGSWLQQPRPSAGLRRA